DLLDGDLDLRLVRVRVHQERVPVAVQLAVALLRDHRLDDHVTRVGDRRHSASSSSVSSALSSASSTSDDAVAPPPSTSPGLPRNSPSAAAVKTTSSATSTSYVLSWSAASGCTIGRLRTLSQLASSARPRTTRILSLVATDRRTARAALVDGVPSP